MSSMPFGAASCWPSMVRFNVSVGRVIRRSAFSRSRVLAFPHSRCGLVHPRAAVGSKPWRRQALDATRKIERANARTRERENAERGTRNPEPESPLLEGTRAAGDVALVFGAVLLDGGDDGTGGEVAQRAEHLAADLARQ